MELWHIVTLAIIQGVTEFLPISSSAHLILFPKLTGLADQGLLMDVAMHVGTLAAVVCYFRGEAAAMLRGAWALVTGAGREDGRLTLNVLGGTIPVVIAGFLFKDVIAGDWRSVPLIAATTVSFGLLLWLADVGGRRKQRKVWAMPLWDALLIGMAQALALVPGVSRSGITMTAALFLGYARPEAARFSLLLSIPTTAAAGLLAGWDLHRSAHPGLLVDAALAAGLSFIAALTAIAGLMAWLRRASFTPFVAYRLALGLFLLALSLSARSA